jgi:hypothetical protein
MLAEQDLNFKNKLVLFVSRLVDSKINILMNFADLIKAPIQNLAVSSNP